MSPAEFDSYRAQAIVEYAAAHVRAGIWSKEQAEEQASAQYSELLPDGRGTKVMLLLVRRGRRWASGWHSVAGTYSSPYGRRRLHL
jgi:hypothetical protein